MPDHFPSQSETPTQHAEETEKAKLWHRRSIVVLAGTAVLFVLLSALSAPKAIVFGFAVLTTGSALWMTWTTMWVFSSKAEADMHTMDEDEPQY